MGKRNNPVVDTTAYDTTVFQVIVFMSPHRFDYEVNEYKAQPIPSGYRLLPPDGERIFASGSKTKMVRTDDLKKIDAVMNDRAGAFIFRSYILSKDDVKGVVDGCVARIKTTLTARRAELDALDFMFGEGIEAK